MQSRRGFGLSCVLLAGLSLGACSPYAYREEIATFGSGVDSSVQAFGALRPAYTAWATEQRDRDLLRGFAASGVRPSTSDGCEELRARYEAAFAATGAPAGDLLTAEDYAGCHVTPVPRVDPDAGLPNIEGLGLALQAYVGALEAVTRVDDEAALEQSFGELNASATALLATVNEELAKKNRPQVEAVGALVYQSGLTYLRQRRFAALRRAVNDYDAAVARAADLLAEAAFHIYGPTLTAKKQALEAAENRAVTVTADSYVAVWRDIDRARDAYVQAFQDSPVYAFIAIKTTHRALRESLNDPANRAQLEAFYDNALALKKAAEAALKAVRADAGGGS